MKEVKIKILNTWYKAAMGRETVYMAGDEQYVVRKYVLCDPIDENTMLTLRETLFSVVECDDGYRCEVYVASIGTLIERVGRKVGNKIMQKEAESEKVLVTHEFYDGAADMHFKETYIFDKSHARVVFTETFPAISGFLFFLFGRKDTVTNTLWMTANGGFVLEREFSSGRKDYSIIEKSEAEVMVREHSEEKYIQIFHPKEI